MNYSSAFFVLNGGFFIIMAWLALAVDSPAAAASSMARKTLVQNASPAADYITGSNNIKQDEAEVNNLVDSHTSSAKPATTESMLNKSHPTSKTINKGGKPKTHLMKEESELMTEERMLLVYYVDYPSAKTHPPTKPPRK